MMSLVLAVAAWVTDVDTCVARVLPKLVAARKRTGRRNAESEIYALDSRSGDKRAASQFMAKHGYETLESPYPHELAFRARFDFDKGEYAGNPQAGLRLACSASHVSHAPFLSVKRQNGTFLIYSVPAN